MYQKFFFFFDGADVDDSKAIGERDEGMMSVMETMKLMI